MKFRAHLVQHLFLAAAVALSPVGASAQVLAYDGFRLSLPVYGFSGTGFSSAWSGVGSFEVGDPSLCHPGLRLSGLSLTANTGGFLFRTLAASIGAPGTTVYASFLIQPLSPPADGFTGLFLDGTTGSIFVGKPGNGATGLYVVETNGGAGQVPSNVAVIPGTTALLVLRIQFNAGNDIITLYANPAPGAPEPAAGVIKSDLDIGTVIGFSFGGFGNTPFAFDELRFGTTYADVVPFDDKQKCK